MTKNQMILCNLFIKLMKASNGATVELKTIESYTSKGYKIEDIHYAMNILIDKGLAKQHDTPDGKINKFYLTRGWIFDTFEKALEDEDKKNLLLENQSTSSIRANKTSLITAATTLIFGLIVTITTILTCGRETKKENREKRREEQDSIHRLQQIKHDTLYEKYLLRKVKDDANTSKSEADTNVSE